MVLELKEFKDVLNDGLVALVIWAASGMIGIFGGYFGAYLKIKAEHLATKEDFEAREVNTLWT